MTANATTTTSDGDAVAAGSARADAPAAPDPHPGDPGRCARPDGLDDHQHRRAHHRPRHRRRRVADQVARRQLRARDGGAAGGGRPARRPVRQAADVPDRHRRVHPRLARGRPVGRPGHADRRPAGPGRLRRAADPAGHRPADRRVQPRSDAHRVLRVRAGDGRIGHRRADPGGLHHQRQHRRADLAADLPDQHRARHRRVHRRAAGCCRATSRPTRSSSTASARACSARACSG